MSQAVVKTFVLLTAVLAITAACWSTTGAPSVRVAVAGLDEDPNQPDPNSPEALPAELAFSTGSLKWLDDEPAEPNDPNDPNVPEKARATVRR